MFYAYSCAIFGFVRSFRICLLIYDVKLFRTNLCSLEQWKLRFPRLTVREKRSFTSGRFILSSLAHVPLSRRFDRDCQSFDFDGIKKNRRKNEKKPTKTNLYAKWVLLVLNRCADIDSDCHRRENPDREEGISSWSSIYLPNLGVLRHTYTQHGREMDPWCYTRCACSLVTVVWMQKQVCALTR